MGKIQNEKLIECILGYLKDCIDANRFQIFQLEKNLNFIAEYNLTKARIIEILQNIKVKDFFESAPSKRIPDSYVYKFSPQVLLCNAFGEEEQVDMYVKFEIQTLESGENAAIISFHNLEYPVTYFPFR